MCLEVQVDWERGRVGTVRFFERPWRVQPAAIGMLVCGVMVVALGGTGLAVAGDHPVPVYRQVAGEIRRIEVSSGDTLVSIGARVGVPWRVLAERNKLDNPNRIYRNVGGDLVLAWTSPEMDKTVSVGWEDIDGDGDLDLAFGNKGPNRVYKNVPAKAESSEVF